MKLYFFPVAPNPTRVRVYLAEKGIEVDQQRVDLPGGEQKRPEHLQRNPFGSLPVLELEDGSCLTESLAIMEYFEERHPEPAMIGTTPLARARVRELERIAEMRVLGPVARTIHATNSPLGLPPSPEVASNAYQGIPFALEVLERRMGDAEFAAGDRPTIADCTLFAAFRFAEFGKVELPNAPRLHAWYARMQQRWSGKY